MTVDGKAFSRRREAVYEAKDTIDKESITVGSLMVKKSNIDSSYKYIILEII